MKKGMIFMVMLVNVLALGFSQTNSWTVTNTSTWIEAVNGIRSGGNSKTYTITVNGNVSIPGSTERTFGTAISVTVNMEGSGTLSISSNGNVLDISAGQTVIAKDITLRGRSNNTGYSAVSIRTGGAFRMEGNASVTGNTDNGNNSVGGGVAVAGTFIMQGGTITGNTATSGGGGVYVAQNGTFTMQGGTISNNTSNSSSSSTYGGGVYVQQGNFTMQDGTITGNTISCNAYDFADGRRPAYGGGVYVGQNGTFTMQGGTISNNTASGNIAQGIYPPPISPARGGGVSVNGTFTMRGGTISGNTVTTAVGGDDAYGGGVHCRRTFVMEGGTISGNTSVSAGGVWVEAGTFTMRNNASVSGNKTSTYGGGGIMIHGGTFTIQDSASVSGNTAAMSGGGVYVAGGSFTMQGSASISGNTAGGSGGGVFVNNGANFLMQGSTSISGNNAILYGGGVCNRGTFNKTGGTIYGNDAETNQRNTVMSRFGSAVYQGSNSGWRNVTAGPTMNPSSYGFWLNDGDLGDVVPFPSHFAGTYKRSNFNNTLTISGSLIKSSSQNFLWVLQRVSGNSYTFKRADTTSTITLTITRAYEDSPIVISGDSGSGQDNWNGTWVSQ